jgi:hypothetical protein
MSIQPNPSWALAVRALTFHQRDADCQGFLGEDGTCQVCGVYHGGPCPWCGGRGFHTDDQCPEVFDRDSPVTRAAESVVVVS